MATSSLSHPQSDNATFRTVQFTPHCYAMWITDGDCRKELESTAGFPQSTESGGGIPHLTQRGQRRRVGMHCMYSVALIDEEAAGKSAE